MRKFSKFVYVCFAVKKIEKCWGRCPVLMIVVGHVLHLVFSLLLSFFSWRGSWILLEHCSPGRSELDLVLSNNFLLRATYDLSEIFFPLALFLHLLFFSSSIFFSFLSDRKREKALEKVFFSAPEGLLVILLSRFHFVFPCRLRKASKSTIKNCMALPSYFFAFQFSLKEHQKKVFAWCIM